MTKTRTFPDTPQTPSRSQEFAAKLQEGAQAAHVHAEETRREAEEAQDLQPEDRSARLGAIGLEAAAARPHADQLRQDATAPAGQDRPDVSDGEPSSR